MIDEPPRLAVASQARLFRFARKELRETLRDRRTILTLVLMPLFVYPLLGLTFQKFLLSQTASLGGRQRPEYVIAFASPNDAEVLSPVIADGELRLLGARDEAELRRKIDADPGAVPLFRAWPSEGGEDVATLVGEGAVDLGIRVRSKERGPTQVEIVYDPASVTAAAAKRAIVDRIDAVNKAWVLERLRRAGIDEPAPLAIDVEPIESKGGGPAVTIAAVLPLVLLLMTVTGAVYPAIDLTAGERERGTLEALVAAPVSRRAILGAKYVAVFAVAVLTAGMNLIAMTATAFSFGLDRMLFGGDVGADTVAQIVALVLVLAAFFSAVLLLVTSFARSFKEAQAYLIPVMLVSLAPGIVGLMPDLPLTLGLAVTPLIGVVLLSRDLLMGDASGLMIAACVGSTLLYAAVALLLAARIFGTDAVLYGSAGTWTEMLRRPELRQGVPTTTAATACLATLFPAFLLLGPIPSRLEDFSASGRFVIRGGLTILLFFVLPCAMAWFYRSDFRTTFRLFRPRLLAWLGAALLGLSLWPFAYEAELFVLSAERIELFKGYFATVRAELDAVPLWLKLVTLAVLPAACEEWLFRGFLLSALCSRLPAWRAVVVTGLIFGAFHVVVGGGLLFERIVPTALLGIVLGAVCVRTGSLWPGVTLHVLHNSLLLMISAYERELSILGWSGGEQTHLPWTWLATAAGAVLVGAVLVRSERSRAAERG